jgi:uncharacterized protein YjbI with pentapeptide repeats
MREIIGSDELKGASIRECDLSGAQLRSVNFSNVKIADAWLFNTDISGQIGGLKINTVEVAPLIEAELDRRHPERTKLRAKDVEGLRAAFDVVDEFWAPTIERARKLSPDKLHERVDGEYSFVETLRHLIFATDSWITRIVLQVPNGHHEWGVTPDLPPDAPPDIGPDLDPVLELRAEKSAAIRDYLSKATDADLAKVNPAPDSTAHPQGSFKVLDCFGVVLAEEWWHNQYATRDLAVLERGA